LDQTGATTMADYYIPVIPVEDLSVCMWGSCLADGPINHCQGLGVKLL